MTRFRGKTNVKGKTLLNIHLRLYRGLRWSDSQMFESWCRQFFLMRMLDLHDNVVFADDT
jgi:hypothetical protein